MKICVLFSPLFSYILRYVCHSEGDTVNKPSDTWKPPAARLPQNIDIELEELNFVHTLDKKRKGK